MFGIETSLPKSYALSKSTYYFADYTHNSLPGSENLGQTIPSSAASVVSQTVQNQLIPWAGNYWILIAGLALIVVAIVLFFVVRKIFINSILGLLVFGIVKFVFNIDLPLIPAVVVSLVFGLAGIGSLLVLKFWGVI